MKNQPFEMHSIRGGKKWLTIVWLILQARTDNRSEIRALLNKYKVKNAAKLTAPQMQPFINDLTELLNTK